MIDDLHDAGRFEAAAPPLRRRIASPKAVLLVASIAVFMAFLDDTVVSIAFPNMLRSFPEATIGELSWVFNAYNIAFAAFLLPAGRLADLLGRRRLFTSGVLLFTASSALCALAPTVAVLIAARALQGIGSAMLVPASLALVLHAHPPERRAGAVGAWAATAALAAGIGPSIGGLLVYAYNWRLVFLINVPIGIAARWLAGRRIVESRAPGRRALPDLLGALLVAASVCSLALAITEAPVWGWGSPAVIAALLFALLTAVAFARRCRIHPAPILDLDLLRAPGFKAVSLITLVGSAGFLALGLANVLCLMDVWHYSALTAGLALTPAPFVAAPTAVLAGHVAERRDPRVLVALGAAVLAAGAAWLALRMGAEPDYLGDYLPAAVLVAVGIGLSFPLVSDAAVSYAPRGRYAGATSMSTAIRLVGGALGVALLASLLSHAAPDALDPFRGAWSFAGVCFALGVPAAYALPRFTRASPEDMALDAAPTPVPLAPAPPTTARPAASNSHVPAAAASAEELLASVSLFADLPAEARRSLAHSTTTLHLPAGEWLFRQGESADAMYVLRSGRLEVVRELEGAEPEPIRELGVGSVVGELALLAGETRSASVRARRDAELLRLSDERLRELLDDAPGFATSVSRALAIQLQKSTVVDVEPLARAATIAVLANDAAAAHSRVESILLRELSGLRRVAHLDRAAAAERHPGAEAGVALARSLDRLEENHDIVIVSAAGGDDAWARACLEQADRILLVIADASHRSPQALPAGRCDAVLLASAAEPTLAALLERLTPRSTHRVRDETRDEDLARLARRLAGRSVGLALSGGGARAFAHLGVIEVLEEAGVVIDRVGGSSMGAFIGALLARGLDAAAIDAHCYEEWVWRNPLTDYGIPRHALFRGRRMRAMMERTLPGVVEDLRLPFYCTAVDIVSNELVVQRSGDLPSAVAASMAVPGVLPPVIRANRLLFDGAVLDGLPVSIMAEQREGSVIACDVTERALRELPADRQPRLPTLVNTLANLAFLTTSDTLAQANRYAELVILPDHEDVGALEFHMLDSLRAAGRRAAVAALEASPRALPR
ncbi:MAG TPA: DHA2 family efflux MFS transporter permease subunit [Solirubrobacteraceae bacterium]|nr:DHA2 family efflux MFS transporter permease subunit [Solirubrobacteraceae bacterium]